MRLVLVCLAWFVALPATASELRRLERVELREDASGTWLSMSTDRPANFTSFKLDAPARVVVDFPETTAEARDADGAGPVRSWSLRTFGDAQSPVVRLVVELREDADYTLTADGTQVALRLRPATGRPLVALDGERISSPAAEPVLEDPIEALPVVAVAPPASVARPASPAEVPETLPVVAAVAPLRAPEPRPAASRPVERAVERKPRASLDQISFRRTPGGARIVLRTSQPVGWALLEGAPDVVYLELEDTHIPATPNRLPLDTRYFGTPVVRVVPREQRQQGSTRVAVELGAPARWSAFADGDDVVLEVTSDAARPALAGGESW